MAVTTASKLSKEAINNAFKALNREDERKKKNYSSHSFRKTFGYFLYKDNVPIEIISQKIYGHKSLAITLLYLDICDDTVIGYLENLNI